MATPLRLLILEDNPSDAELVLHTLRRAGYDPIGERVETEQGFLDHLHPAPEIILSDFTMPEFDALRALEIIQERQMDIPFIIVSGTIGEERAVQVMQSGATDYIIKDRLGRLGSAVTQALARWQLKEAKLKAEQTVAQLAAIVETSGDAIIAQSLDGIITSWNRAAEDLYGFLANEIIGKHISILFPRGRRQSDAVENPQDNLNKVGHGEHIAAFETVRVRQDGRRIEVLLSISPIRDGKGVVIGASTIAIDITQRKRADRFLSAEQVVTGTLTECKNLAEAGPRVLQTIGECFRWEVAVLWTIDRPANVLRRMHSWHASWADPVFIEALSQRSVLDYGMGVAGRTWSLGELVWERGIRMDGHPAEASAMTRDGLRCGFGLPMRQGSEMVGVIEFYNPELREPDNALIAALDSIACQISQFCERRRTEAALRVSEERYRVLADNLPLGVLTWSPDGGCDYCNEWWFNYTGLTEAQMQGNGWADAIHSADRNEALENWVESSRNCRSFQTEIRFRRVDGVDRWFLVRAEPLKDEVGQVIKWFGTCVDIDVQRRSHEVVRISEERFRTLVMALPAAVYTTDKEGLITLFNEHAAKLWGRRPELGRDRWCGAWQLLRLDGTPMPPDQTPMAVTLREGRYVHGEEYIIERPDGSRAFVLKHPEPLRDAAGEIVGAVNMLIDLTQIKQLEEQYRQSQKMEAVGQLAAGVAHDFNNLLTIILGYSELFLSRLPVADPGRELMEQVHRAGERAAALTRQLLAFGRKQLLAPVVLDLNSVMVETKTMLSRLIGADIELITNFQPDLGSVKVDPGQIEQVIMNLVVNARDAMPTGGRLTIRTSNTVLSELQIRQHAECTPGSFSLLTVSDTGRGMNEATKARIFEPFFTTKDVGRGTGLGLATVFGIVRQSGGFIEVDSALGSGSSFRAYFPQVREAPRLKESDRGPLKIPGGTETILLVEDEDDLRAFAKLLLEESGYKILIAQNGAEAVRVCFQYADVIDLLFTDVVMPKMSGRQLTDLLLVSRPKMKVLYMSGYTDDTMVRHGIEDAGTNFLAKPFTYAALAQKVREVLDGTNGKHEVVGIGTAAAIPVGAS